MARVQVPREAKPTDVKSGAKKTIKGNKPPVAAEKEEEEEEAVEEEAEAPEVSQLSSGSGSSAHSAPSAPSKKTKSGGGKKADVKGKGGKKKIKGITGGKRISVAIRAIPKYNVWIHRVQLQVAPRCTISKASMSILNSFVNDMFERVTFEASKLVRYSKKATLDAKSLQTAVRLLVPGELGRHAVSEGTKAVTKFNGF